MQSVFGVCAEYKSCIYEYLNVCVIWQVLLQRGVMRLPATRDHRHVGTGSAEEEAE